MTTRTALVVEDDPSAQRFVEMQLRRMGWKVLVVDDGRAALQIVNTARPDLVCLDLGLPNISGYDVCEAIRRSPVSSDVPILVTTGHRLPQKQVLARQLGANGYLVKPFTAEEFRAAVLSVLPAPSPRVEEHRDVAR